MGLIIALIFTLICRLFTKSDDPFWITLSVVYLVTWFIWQIFSADDLGSFMNSLEIWNHILFWAIFVWRGSLFVGPILLIFNQDIGYVALGIGWFINIALLVFMVFGSIFIGDDFEQNTFESTAFVALLAF